MQQDNTALKSTGTEGLKIISGRKKTMTEQEIVEKALRMERELKGELYHNVRPFIPSDAPLEGPRAAFVAEYGIDGSSKAQRILKTDKAVIKNPRARMHYEHGCTTANDFRQLTDMGRDARVHHISPIVDFWRVPDDYDPSLTHSVVAEDFFGEHRWIYGMMPELDKKPLTKKEFEIISNHVLDALAYTDQQEKYQRDWSLRNIITNIRSHGEEQPFIQKYLSTVQSWFKKTTAEKEPHTEKTALEAIVTDYANACRKDHPELTLQPTMGATQVLDILMVPGVTKTPQAYNDTTETYAVAKTLLEMLVGEQIIAADQTQGTAKVLRTRFVEEEDLFVNGVFNHDRYAQAISTALTQIPTHATKYAPVFRRALSSDPKKRYSSTQEFIKDWHAHSTKDWQSRTKRALRVAAGVVMLASLATTTYTTLRELEPELLPVKAVWNEETKEVENNYLRLDVASVYYGGSYPIIGSTPKNPAHFLAPQGEKIHVSVSALYQPIDSSKHTDHRFRGVAYIEGEDAQKTRKTFTIQPVVPGTYSEYGTLGNYNTIDMVAIPEGTTEGTVRNLIIELYPAADTGYVRGWNANLQQYTQIPKVLFDQSTPIVRKKIPMVSVRSRVNNIRDSSIAVTADAYIPYGYDRAVHFKTVLDEQDYIMMNRDLKFVVRVPEIGYVNRFDASKENSNSRAIMPWLPSGESRNDLTIHAITYKGDTILNQSFIPVARRSVSGPEGWYSTYETRIPDSTFAYTAAKYGAEAQKFIK